MADRTCIVCQTPILPPKTRFCSKRCNAFVNNQKRTPFGLAGLKYCHQCSRRLPAMKAFGLHARICLECQDLKNRGLKRCTKCGEVKNRSEFHLRYQRPDGQSSDCKPCAAARAASRNARPEVAARQRDRKYQLKYGITAAEFDSRAAAQGGLCAICDRRPERGPLEVDHDHQCCDSDRTCGRCLRGLICGPCNRALSMIRDDPDVAIAMADYLIRRKVT